MSEPPGPRPRAEGDFDDLRLLERLQAGDRGALGALFDRHSVALRHFVARAASLDEAEDVVQGVFIRAMERVGSFDPARGAVRAWLFGIAAHMIREWRRGAARKARAYVRMLVVTERHERHERRDVEAALARLSEAKRTVILLAEVEGFTCEEIAAMLAVPVGTVWTRLHHARNELRACLGGRDG